MATLVSVNPSSILSFNLERGKQAKTTLTITNVSQKKVVFKVKTKNPNWYYVKPNLDMLDVGESRSIQIVIVETESNTFLDQVSAGDESASDMIDSHRFLVQSKVVDDNDFTRIKDLPLAKKIEEMSKLWNGSQEGKSIKLKVEFKYSVSSSPTRLPQNADEHLKIVRDTLARSQSEMNSSASSPEMMLTELQNWRKKYDGVVEYTVQLTVERDSLLQQLEALQKELTKEKSKKKEQIGVATKMGEKGEKKIEKGFPLIVVLITALICFLIGKYVG